MKRTILKKWMVTLFITLLYFNIGIQGMMEDANLCKDEKKETQLKKNSWFSNCRCNNDPSKNEKILLKKNTDLTNEYKNEIDKKSTQNVIKTVLTNIYAKADENLKCMVCYEHFPVSFRFSCGHELCALCAQKIMSVSNKKCPKCRAIIPNDIYKLLTMAHISPISMQITPDITLAKLQHAFPLICYVANLTTVAKCIRLGVDVNTKGFSNYFPVHLTSQKSVVKYLVEHGANVHSVNGTGSTPLFMSSGNGHLQVVQYLIEHGADVNQAANNGSTPLFVSSQEGHLPVVQYLIEHGADVNQGNRDGATPLLVSSENGHLKVVQYLIDHGADVNQAANNGVTPLYISSQEGHLPVVEYLIQHGADVNRGDNDGATPLFMSSQNGNLPIAQYLIKHGADVNQAKNDGTTPLYMSSQNGHLQVVECLIKHGADVNQGRRNEGFTPLCSAINKNQTEVAKFLLSKNANIEITKVLFRKFGNLELIEILEKLCKEIEE